MVLAAPMLAHAGRRAQWAARARLLSAVVMTLLLLAGCSAGPVDVPPDAPLQRADCGWPESTELAFAGWSTPDKLGLGMMDDVPGTPAQVYALVTLEAVAPSGEAAEPIRQFCARSIDGEIHHGAVAETWRPPADPAP